jgi:xylulose-5-phosphate/fructose-6-phosphate phosphoketolase
MEMLSEHTVEGWLEGYILSGGMDRSTAMSLSFTSSTRCSIKHAKWLEKCKELAWRAPISSLNLLITGLVWRQDHNVSLTRIRVFGCVANKSPE